MNRLYDAISKVVTSPDLQERLKPFSFQTAITTGPQFRDLVRSESVRWQKVIRDNGIKGEAQ